MQVFISWSGEVSQDVANALKKWLPNVIQTINVFVSSEDIQKGRRWFSEIGTQLEKSDFGILCLTPDNLEKPWILFEAGALSKKLDLARVSPLLIGLKISDLRGPLAQFNATLTEKEEIWKLLKTINEQLNDKGLSEPQLNKTFEKWWSDLDGSIQEALMKDRGKGVASKPKRDSQDILEELLGLTRTIAQGFNQGIVRPFEMPYEESRKLFDEFLKTLGMTREDVLGLRTSCEEACKALGISTGVSFSSPEAQYKIVRYLLDFYKNRPNDA